MKERFRTIIADDEAAARSRIRKLLSGEPGFEIVAEAQNGPEAVAAVRQHKPDLLFLDVQMPGFDGFEVLARLLRDRMPAVVFVTAYEQYALRAFDAHAVDYLLKPFDDERFADALAHAHRRLREGWSETVRGVLRDVLDAGRLNDHAEPIGDARTGERLRRIAVRNRDEILLVEVGDIEWIEAAGDYTCLHAGSARHLTRHSLAELERKLDERFVRVHRSAIVRKDAVGRLTARSHGDYVVLLRDGTELRLSRSHREAFAKALGIEL